MKKYIFLAASLLFGSAMAQDTYDAANLAGSDLNGTARYVGMGGALGALGGDITVMGSNPAGTALFRHNEVNFGMSGLFTEEKGQLGHDGGRASFDHAGIVFALDQESRSNKGLQYVNFGINYRKKRNFFGNIFTQPRLGGLSQTTQIFDMVDQCYYNFGNSIDNDGYINDRWGYLAYLGEPVVTLTDAQGNVTYADEASTGAIYQRATYGGTAEADFNLSFNVSDQFFYGVTLGVYDINSKRESFYQEALADGTIYDFTNWYHTKGEGFDLKFGFICRPVDDSPFRFGLAIHTPTWYNLEDVNGAEMYLNDQFQDRISSSPFEYSYRTPWKFGVSLGHTFDKIVAIGAEYEYSDLSTAKYDSRDWDNDPYFRDINENTKNALKPVHTFKLGVEYKPVDDFSIRFGYNHVTAPFKEDAFKTLYYIDGPFTETDYINWKGTDRISVGLGYRWNGGYFDVAYQLQSQKGDFYAFDNINLKPTEVKNNRSQLLATLGFRF